MWTFCLSHSITSSQPPEACVMPQLPAALITKIIGSLSHPFIPAWSALRAAGWLEPIPALGGGEAGHNLDKQPVHPGTSINRQPQLTLTSAWLVWERRWKELMGRRPTGRTWQLCKERAGWTGNWTRDLPAGLTSNPPLQYHILVILLRWQGAEQHRGQSVKTAVWSSSF